MNNGYEIIEQSVLGSIIKDSKLIDNFFSKYNEKYFTQYLAIKLYTKLKEFNTNGQGFDETLLKSLIKDDDKLRDFVVVCTESAPDLTMYAFYLEQLSEYKIRRDIKDLGITLYVSENNEIEKLLEEATIKLNTLQPDKIIDKKQKLDDVITEYENLHKRGDEMNSGFPSFDKLINGFRKKRLYVLGGEPGTGKTGLALYLAQRIAYEQKKKVLFFSLEMSEFDMVGRLASLIGGVPSWRVQQPWLLQPDDFIKITNSCAKIYKSNLELEYDNWTVSEMIVKIKKVKPDIVFIDHLQSLPMTMDRNEKHHDVLNKSVKLLRDTAKSEDLCLFVLSQMKKNSTGNTNEEEFKNSAGIREQADLGMVIKKEKKKNTIVGKPEGYLHLSINKNRNGKQGYVPLLFNQETLRFGEFCELEVW